MCVLSRWYTMARMETLFQTAQEQLPETASHLHAHGPAWRLVFAADRLLAGLLVALILSVFGQLTDSPHCLLGSEAAVHACDASDTDLPPGVTSSTVSDTYGSRAPTQVPPSHILHHVHGQHIVLLTVIALTPLLVVLTCSCTLYPNLPQPDFTPIPPPPRFAHR